MCHLCCIGPLATQRPIYHLRLWPGPGPPQRTQGIHQSLQVNTNISNTGLQLLADFMAGLLMQTSQPGKHITSSVGVWLRQGTVAGLALQWNICCKQVALQ